MFKHQANGHSLNAEIWLGWNSAKGCEFYRQKTNPGYLKQTKTYTKI